MKYLKFILLILFLLTFSLNAETFVANSCSLSDVQDAIDLTSTGDTVTVPSGECSWNGYVSIPTEKKITLQGAGIDSTIINSIFEWDDVIRIDTSGSRVTGFTIKDGFVRVDGTGWRVDHCSFSNSTWEDSVIGTSFSARSPDTRTVAGLIDNCTFSKGRILAGGTSYGLAEDGSQHDLWANALNLGTSEAVYVEDCTFTDGINAIDSNYGGRYIFRFNNITDTDIEAHSVQGNNRAVRKWEVYGNSINQTNGFHSIFLRAGTGVIFDNDITGTVYFKLDNVRSFTDEGGTVGQCDGNSVWDGNEDATGWPCRDQIGMGIDTALWTDEDPYPTQTKVPAYFWNNYTGETPLLAQVVNTPSEDHIKADRDYYDLDTSFDGTSGVGVGVLASIPATCTAGVGYWATDQGDWNATGDDGVLYKCTSTDTWEVYYEPYDYPHPLRCYGRRGDANLSETITIADVVAVLKHIAGTATLEGLALTAADADEDSDVDGDDVTRILQHITGANPLAGCE